MLFNSPTEWVALGVTLIAGWLFGLASSSGGKKWKNQLQDSEIDAAAYRDESERALRDANARIRELEQERDDAMRAAPTPPVSVDEPEPERSGTSFVPLAAAAGVGAAAATFFNRDRSDDAEAATPVEAVTPVESVTPDEPATPVEPEPNRSWIPEGPPPPPLSMGTPEPAPQPQPQPIAPDAPAYPTAPALVQEEVKAAEPDQSFQTPAPPPRPVAASAATPAFASPAPVAVEPPAPTPVGESEPVQKKHEWLPPHVRADI